MRLFWRAHVPLISIYLIQMLLIPFIYWLAGYQDLSIALYSILLSSSFLIGYLIYRYLSLQPVYDRLTKPLQTLDESIQTMGTNPLSEAFHDVLQSQFQLYQNQAHHLQNKFRNHITFLNQWVHQMKTPLSVIHLTIQDEDDPIFHSIQEELDRLRKGLETILYSSRLEQFEHDFHVKPLLLQDVVRTVIFHNKRLFIRNQVYPDIQIEEGIKVYSDEKWLLFMLDQLITNAVRYASGSRTKIEFTSRSQRNQIVLQVKDHGIGIPKEDMRRVFEPYFTGKHGREYSESTGMGLHFVREICKRLDHQVELESEVGVGTVAKVIFTDPKSKC